MGQIQHVMDFGSPRFAPAVSLEGLLYGLTPLIQVKIQPKFSLHFPTTLVLAYKSRHIIILLKTTENKLLFLIIFI